MGFDAVDCSDDKDKTSAECICRLPKNWHEEICQGPKWFGNGQLRPRIINGEVVEANVYNWFARATEGASWGGCGGSLVTPEYVLTAAHCVQGAINNLENNGGYQIGALCAPYGPSNGNNCGQKVESFGIRKITQHPNYNDNTVNKISLWSVSMAYHLFLQLKWIPEIFLQGMKVCPPRQTCGQLVLEQQKLVTFRANFFMSMSTM